MLNEVFDLPDAGVSTLMCQPSGPSQLTQISMLRMRANSI